MTEVAFHFNAPDKLAYACRFARKVLRSEMRLVIAGPEESLDRLDRMLWALGPSDFVAHARSGGDEDMVAASPVLLTADPRESSHQDVLLNLGHNVPEGFARFQKLVEVVSAHDDADRQAARERWRHYAGRGYEIVRHDLVLKGG
ncbi:DNA polymerase III subunit chi [Paracidovorax wautersii]|uniref:DNA polymerase-3 subunit chi n=1 Tax=Paracidovorax wautersii TaxID=1177982 RepID=A0ABU1IDM9_9BURK|nr:DNA polymerase III subunit chi [Paracidovorax wautersii]MDR6215335.1 DNA polymerase-3 subunit chi [Paracidovorax wautersii]